MSARLSVCISSSPSWSLSFSRHRMRVASVTREQVDCFSFECWSVAGPPVWLVSSARSLGSFVHSAASKDANRLHSKFRRRPFRPLPLSLSLSLSPALFRRPRPSRLSDLLRNMRQWQRKGDESSQASRWQRQAARLADADNNHQPVSKRPLSLGAVVAVLSVRRRPSFVVCSLWRAVSGALSICGRVSESVRYGNRENLPR